jgi:shikimate kinase
MINYQKIYIIGFMGSGKTTAGKKLALLLDWAFLDLDKKIEEYTCLKIPEIFASHGEEYFRNVESQVLKNLKPLSNIVISTGGGTPCHNNNMDFMLDTGLTIYLKLGPEMLKSRLSDSKTDRPLIKGITGDNLLSYIETTLSLREKYYNKAEMQISGDNIDFPALSSRIKRRFNI